MYELFLIVDYMFYTQPLLYILHTFGFYKGMNLKEVSLSRTGKWEKSLGSSRSQKGYRMKYHIDR